MIVVICWRRYFSALLDGSWFVLEAFALLLLFLGGFRIVVAILGSLPDGCCVYPEAFG